MSSIGIVAVREASQQDGRRFVCTLRTWEFLRDLGQTFGWRPRGTIYVNNSRQKTPPLLPIRHNYQPGGLQDYKSIEAADAAEWAASLGVARRSAYFSGMIGAYAGLVGSPREPLSSTVDEFIDFAYQGAFVFALSPESDEIERQLAPAGGASA